MQNGPATLLIVAAWRAEYLDGSPRGPPGRQGAKPSGEMKMLNKIGALSACGLVAATLAAASPAAAALTVYSGYDAFATDVQVRPNSDAARDAYLAGTAGLGVDHLASFEGPFGAFSSYDLGGGGTATGVDIFGAQQTILSAPLCFSSLCGYNTTPGGIGFLSLYGGEATFDFLDPILAFGAYFSGAQIEGITLTFNDGEVRSIDVPGHYGIDFVGFSDPGKAISQVKLNIGNDIIAMDDLRFTTAFDQAGGVPEPATWAMMIAGFGLIGATLRRRNGLAAAA